MNILVILLPITFFFNTIILFTPATTRTPYAAAYFIHLPPHRCLTRPHRYPLGPTPTVVQRRTNGPGSVDRPCLCTFVPLRTRGVRTRLRIRLPSSADVLQTRDAYLLPPPPITPYHITLPYPTLPPPATPPPPTTPAPHLPALPHTLPFTRTVTPGTPYLPHTTLPTPYPTQPHPTHLPTPIAAFARHPTHPTLPPPLHTHTPLPGLDRHCPLCGTFLLLLLCLPTGWTRIPPICHC